jgi:hypothetical protein
MISANRKSEVLLDISGNPTNQELRPRAKYFFLTSHFIERGNRDGTGCDSRLTYDNFSSVRGIVAESMGFAGRIEVDSRRPGAACFGGRL